MKKIGIIKFMGILILTLGITDLNFENLNFDVNVKAFAAIIIGIIITILSFLATKKLKD
ncbi:hypothetical protein H9W90_10215 [Polaribacter pectinis]|uniref:Uncharacterized protein n=1 Tax=Polaribacter pectinis TaxID=2738844 RepID=A0A7G9L7H1_9FLAO|nr:hypothetical protein [Polaribacter pectinis]QNM84570.1 hypothetical protein H9W90_10215 [Polaribacter pectinis]